MTTWLVIDPDINYAKTFDNLYIDKKTALNITADPNYSSYCHKFAANYDLLLFIMRVYHGSAIIVCFYREIYDSKMSDLAKLMKFLEIYFSFANVGILILATKGFLDLEEVRIFNKFEKDKLYDIECFKDQKALYKWAGRCQEWFGIEIMVSLAYMFTMIILLMKSRFAKVGVDQT